MYNDNFYMCLVILLVTSAFCVPIWCICYGSSRTNNNKSYEIL